MSKKLTKDVRAMSIGSTSPSKPAAAKPKTPLAVKTDKSPVNGRRFSTPLQGQEPVSPSKKVDSLSSPKSPAVLQMRRRLSVVSGAPQQQQRKYLDGYADKKEAKTALSPASERGAQGAGKAAYTAYASLSKVGFVPFNNAKVNQDRAGVSVKFGGAEDRAVFGVYDGHGVKGHEVSQYVARELPRHMLAQKNLDEDPHAAISRAFVDCNEALKTSAIEVAFSGTTAIVCYFNGKRILACNAGDSRAVIGQLQSDGRYAPVPLSNDHKPDRPDEKKRIIESGGRVHACKTSDGQEIGPPRVWLGDQDVPGLAMTRSLGDATAGTVGVSPVPEITEREIQSVDRFVVLGSDGVWEFLTNQEVVDIVARASVPEDACTALVTEASRRWRSQEEVIDDITCIVIWLPGK